MYTTLYTLDHFWCFGSPFSHHFPIIFPWFSHEECKEVDVVGILKSLKTCPDAYAIFETEAARDAAVESAGAGGVEFNGNTLKLNASRGLAPGELGIAGDHFLGQEINIELLGMVDYDLHQYGVFMFIKQINQQININYGVFMFIKLGFTTVDGKKTSGLIFTGALLTAGRVVGRKAGWWWWWWLVVTIVTLVIMIAMTWHDQMTT